jgi:hypothetical protein
VVTAVTTEMVRYEERKKCDWYDEECQIKVGVRNKSQINMLNGTRINTENYKNK